MVALAAALSNKYLLLSKQRPSSTTTPPLPLAQVSIVSLCNLIYTLILLHHRFLRALFYNCASIVESSVTTGCLLRLAWTKGGGLLDFHKYVFLKSLRILGRGIRAVLYCYSVVLIFKRKQIAHPLLEVNLHRQVI